MKHIVKIIHGEIYSHDFDRLDQLVNDWSSAYRYAFNRFQKDRLSFNDVRKATKRAYYPLLNTRQISDAVNQAQGLYNRIGNRKVIFGGKLNWNKLIKGNISNQEWKLVRNSQIYTRGDSTKKGNPNLRIVEENEKLYLRVTTGNRQFEYYKLFITNKFREQLDFTMHSGIAYNVRLIKKDKYHYIVVIDYKIRAPETVIDFSNGVIGIDVNPDKVAVSNISRDGNLVDSFTIVNTRMLYGSTNKRNYETSIIVKQIIQYAVEHDKGIVFENLKFKKQFVDQGKRFNRVKSNFVWRKLITLLERKCIENGIKYKKVNPAFTSVMGKLKYQQMYNLTIHESAAYVIAHRGLGFQEKLSLYGYPSGVVKTLVLNLAGRGAKRVHNWYLWRILRDNLSILTGSLTRTLNLKEFSGFPLNGMVSSVGEIPTG